jgi:hypothetical protein
MSWWVYLKNKKTGKTLPVYPHVEGGTYTPGGCHNAEINITYNYSRWYYLHLDTDSGLRWLNGKPAHRTIQRLRYAIGMLGTQRSDDYWNGSPGNAGYTLGMLLSWAEQHPNGEWVIH